MAGSSRRSGKTNRRSEILDAAEKLMRTRGLSGVTTRQISREVGCSEGALYVHFKGRLDLLLAMLEESLPNMLGPLRSLRESVGRGSAHQNLVQALGGIFKFHRSVVPRTAGLFAEPELLAAYRSSLNRQGKGPQLSMKVLEEYIRSEQQLGRIASHVDPKLAASMMMSASFFRAFVENFFGKSMQPAWGAFAEQLVATVVPKPG
ncbi:MAG TPA: TetR/AcrR family transcriptional regulator [Candidatus Acidoferrum sp.]|nr:TetR/AcrR family transcriptional regulator [Candidatus Acidoferrum sp.]